MKRFVISLVIVILTAPQLFSEIMHEEVFEETKLVVVAGDAKSAFDTIEYEGLQFNSEIGAPQLPVKYLNMIIPFEMEIDRIDLVVDGVTLPGEHRLMPVQAPRPTNSSIPAFVEPDPNIYAKNALYPKDIVSIVDYGFMAGFAKIVRLRVNPVQYNPSTRELQWNSRIAFKLEFKKSKKKPLVSGIRSERSQEVYRGLLEKIVANSHDIQRCAIPVKIAGKSNSDSVIDYLIVAPQTLLDSTEPSAFQGFVDWKREKGWKVKTVSYDQIWDAGYYQDDLHELPIVSQAGGLRKFLYDQHTENGVTFVLLVGDETNSPIMYKGYQLIAHDNIPSDLYFADFDGDWNVDGDELYGDDVDYVKDIFVGRLLAPSNSKAEVRNWVKKLLVYETNPGDGDPSYVMNAFFHSADGIYESGASPLVGEYLEGFGFNVTVSYEWDGENPQSATILGPTGTQVVEWMRDGNGFVALDCHGSKERVHVSTTGYNDPPVYAVYSDSDYWIPGDWPIWEGGTNDLLHDIVNDQYHYSHSVSCDNAGYDIDFDWTGAYIPDVESWVSFARMFTNGQGGITGPAIIANTRYGWYGSSLNLRRTFFQVLLEGGAPYPQSSHKIGVAEAGSKALYTSDYLAHSSTLFGDPEMDIWTAVPNNLHVYVNLEDRWALVYEIDDDGAELPVVGALVAFFDGQEYFYSRTNERGIAEWKPCEFELQKVTASKVNYIPSRTFVNREGVMH